MNRNDWHGCVRCVMQFTNWTAGAQPYPAPAVCLASGFVAGGSSAHHVRVLAPRRAEPPGHTVIVENRAGAGGNIGTGAVARAARDRRTLARRARAAGIQPQ
jgi:tripartite-type tricarboxylate transporter receptor subunit TctC